MTRKELEYIRTILLSIKNCDQHIAKGIAYVDKDLAMYNARKGQLKEQYEYDSRFFQ